MVYRVVHDGFHDISMPDPNTRSLIATDLTHTTSSGVYKCGIRDGLDLVFRFGKYRNCRDFSFHMFNKFIFPFRDRNWHLPRIAGGLSVGHRA